MNCLMGIVVGCTQDVMVQRDLPVPRVSDECKTECSIVKFLADQNLRLNRICVRWQFIDVEKFVLRNEILDKAPPKRARVGAKCGSDAGARRLGNVNEDEFF